MVLKYYQSIKVRKLYILNIQCIVYARIYIHTGPTPLTYISE